jgi:hypothetical protein
MSTFEETLTFTRADPGMYLDSVVYGEELVTNGGFSDGTTGWSAAYQSTISVVNGALRVTSTNNNPYATQDVVVEAGKEYAVTLDSLTKTGGSVRVFFGSETGLAKMDLGTHGLDQDTSRVFFVAATTGVLNIQLVGSSMSAGDYFDIDNVSVKEAASNQSGKPILRTATVNTPRFEYDAEGNPLGLLIEEGRTNLFRQNYNLALAEQQLSVTINAATAPDGNKAAAFCVPSSLNLEHYLDDQDVDSSKNYSVSFYGKAGDSTDNIGLRASGIGSNYPRWDLNSGTVTDEGNSPAWTNTRIEDVGNGWYRCSSNANPTSNTPLRVQFIKGGEHRFNGDGTGHYLWGLQVEEGYFPTSYIATNGTEESRSADICSMPLSKFAYQQKEGTIYAEFDSQVNQAQPTTDGTFFRRIYEFGNKLIGDNRMNTTVRHTDGATIFNLFDGNVTQAGITDSTGFDGFIPTTKVASTFEVDQVKFVVNGSYVGQDITVALNSNRDVLAIMTAGNGNGRMSTGHIKSLKYFPRKMTNAELEAMTA